MRRVLIPALLALLVLMASLPLCGLADTRITLDSIYAQFTLDEENYIIFQEDNLDKHQEWMANRSLTKEMLLEDWAKRGVLLQAWTLDSDACLEVTAVKDEWASKYFDLDQQTPAIRSSYRSAHLKGTLAGSESYTYQSAEWKKTTQYGRFLMLKYKQTSGSSTIRGYARRAVRNGYTITVDYKVYGRALKTQDQNAINKIMSDWHFTTVLPLAAADATDGVLVSETGATSSAASTANAVFTDEPPRETNTGSFTVKGTCNPNLHLIGVLMRMSSSEPLRIEADASKKGKFSMPVTLPEEGTWLMTLTFKDGTKTVGETVFHTTNYASGILPVNFAEEMPDTFPGDTYTLSGTTIKNVKIQCMVEETGYNKQVTTNNSGKFSFKLKTSLEGKYHITLSFQKKNFAMRRFTFEVSRTMTEAEKEAAIRESAVKPAYSTLTKKLGNYIGRYMTYNLILTDVVQSGDENILFMAMRSTKTGYKDLVVVSTDKDVSSLIVGETYRIYGQLTGNYEVQSAEGGSTYYPCFDLLFFGS